MRFNRIDQGVLREEPGQDISLLGVIVNQEHIEFPRQRSELSRTFNRHGNLFRADTTSSGGRVPGPLATFSHQSPINNSHRFKAGQEEQANTAY
jgi:hypothetical protein